MKKVIGLTVVMLILLWGVPIYLVYAASLEDCNADKHILTEVLEPKPINTWVVKSVVRINVDHSIGQYTLVSIPHSFETEKVLYMMDKINMFEPGDTLRMMHK